MKTTMMLYKKSSHTDDPSSAPRPEENFDAVYQKEQLKMHEKTEHIMAISEHLKDRYKNYEEAGYFIDFLRALENVLLSAQVNNWDMRRVEQELIESEIYLMATNFGIDEKVFHAIYDDFQSLFTDATKVEHVTQKLLAEYGDCEECRAFIRFLHDFAIVFLHPNGNGFEEKKEHMVRARMGSLSADGVPDLHILETIYQEFSELVEKRPQKAQ